MSLEEILLGHMCSSTMANDLAGCMTLHPSKGRDDAILGVTPFHSFSVSKSNTRGTAPKRPSMYPLRRFNSFLYRNSDKG